VTTSTSSVRRFVASRRWLVLLAVLGTLLRFGLIARTTHNERFYDEVDYDHIAVSLMHGHGFSDHVPFVEKVDHPTAFRAPGQPVFIALVYLVTGPRPVAVEIVQAMLLAALPFLCAQIGRRIGLSPIAANLGATIAALHPILSYAATTLYPSVLTTVALTCGIWLCWETIERNQARWAVAAGASFGIAAAATTTFAPVALLAALIIAFRRRMKLAILVAVIGLAPSATWMVRNQIVLHDFTLATNGGYNLELGANDDATPRSGNWITLYPKWELGEVKADALLREQAERWIHMHHTHYLELSILRAFAAFDSTGRPRTQGVNSGSGAEIAGYLLLPIVLAGFFGLFLYWRSPIAWVTAGALALVILSSALTLAKPRFRLPVDPALCVFAVGTVSIAARRIGRSTRYLKACLAGFSSRFSRSAWRHRRRVLHLPMPTCCAAHMAPIAPTTTCSPTTSTCGSIRRTSS
jgi:4-amino-4-deoxy-L-arabinose transferase-like glycosyltransferase